MIRDKKFINAAMLAAFIMVITIAGCSNKEAVNKDKAATAVDNTSMSKENNPDKKYDDFIEQRNLLKKENLPILRDLLKKANAYCGTGFYVETETKDNGIKGNSITKGYYQDGNLREENYDMESGKLKYLKIYNKDEDRIYDYDASKDMLKKSENESKQNKINISNIYQYGFFDLNNGKNGEFKTIDYNGKKAVYSHYASLYDEEPKQEGQFKQDEQYWYDAETGIIIKEETRIFDKDGKEKMNSSSKYTVKPKQKFDKSIFKYDPNNKTVGDSKGK